MTAREWLEMILKADGRDLAAQVGWGFTDGDLWKLGRLHQVAGSGLVRERIEEMLEDSNFHTEVKLLKAGSYAEYLDRL